MTFKTRTLGFFVATALIAPCLAHADTTVVRERFSDEIVGSGPDVVFIPGLASSRDTWKATAERLKTRYRVHLLQVAGFAGEPSRGNASGAVVVPTAEAIDAYFVEQHLTPVTIIGHSLGGTMALYLSEHHPEHVKKAMLVDALPFFATLMMGPNATVDSVKPIADKIRMGNAPMSDAQRRQMMRSMASAPSDVAMIENWSASSNKSAVDNATADDMTLDLRPGLSKLTTPIVLLHPDYVPLGSPPGVSDQMYRAAYAVAPTVKVVEIASALHFLMLDQPTKFDAALDEFLAQ